GSPQHWSSSQVSLLMSAPQDQPPAAHSGSANASEPQKSEQMKEAVSPSHSHKVPVVQVQPSSSQSAEVSLEPASSQQGGPIGRFALQAAGPASSPPAPASSPPPPASSGPASSSGVMVVGGVHAARVSVTSATTAKRPMR